MKKLLQRAGAFLLDYLFPSLRDAFFIGALFAVAVQGHMLVNADGDIGRHITIGNYIVENRTIPTTDVFSHTKKIPQSRGGEVDWEFIKK